MTSRVLAYWCALWQAMYQAIDDMREESNQADVVAAMERDFHENELLQLSHQLGRCQPSSYVSLVPN